MIQTNYKYVSKVRLSPVRAIRAYCLGVCAGSAKEVRLCTTPECPLYEFRFSKNYARAGIGGGARNEKGRFIPKKSHTTGPDLIMTPKEYPSKGEAVLTRPASNKLEYAQSQVEEAEGKIRIKRTTAGLVISLTQASKNH